MNDSNDKSNSLLAAALEYARLGYPVFPCHPGGKTPLTAHGFKDASTDPEQIHRWWAMWPYANVAINMAGLVAIDIDPLDDGGPNPWPNDPEKMASLVDCTRAMAVTPRGGHHRIFRKPEGKPWSISSDDLAESVDVRTDGGYIVAEPSEVKGKPYQWLPGLELNFPRKDLAETPAWLSEALDEVHGRKQKPKPAPVDAVEHSEPLGGGGDGNWREPIERDYEASVTWAEILEPFGWVHVGETKDGLLTWRRPGKEDGHSATTGIRSSGNDILHVFSGNARPFEAGRSYGKFRAYAELNHRGVQNDAAEALRDLGYGRQPQNGGADLSGFRVSKGAAKLAEADKGGKADRAPCVVCLADVEPREVAWLWPGRIPLGHLTMFAGPAGLGKSLLTIDAAARVTRGWDWPDGSPAAKGSVLLITSEDDLEATLRPRLDVAGADVGSVHHLAGIRTRDPRGKELETAWTVQDCDMLEATLERLPDCRLVVIDPVGSYIGGRLDAAKDNEVRSALNPLVRIAASKGVAIMLVAHVRKMPSLTADDAVLGSRAFTALSRSVLHLVADPEDKDRRLLLAGKCNLARKALGWGYTIRDVDGMPQVEWDTDPLDKLADDFFGPAGVSERKRGPKAVKRGEAERWLEDQLANGPVSVETLKAEAKSAGLAWASIRRAQEVLEVQPRKTSFSGGWEWHWPEHIPNLSTFAASSIETRGFSQDAQLEHLGEDAQVSNLSILGEDTPSTDQQESESTAKQESATPPQDAQQTT